MLVETVCNFPPKRHAHNPAAQKQQLYNLMEGAERLQPSPPSERLICKSFEQPKFSASARMSTFLCEDSTSQTSRLASCCTWAYSRGNLYSIYRNPTTPISFTIPSHVQSLRAHMASLVRRYRTTQVRMITICPTILSDVEHHGASECAFDSPQPCCNCVSGCGGL